MAETIITQLAPSDEPAWRAYVNSHPDATIYHTLEWRDIVYNEYGFEPIYLLAEEAGRIDGILPLFFVKTLRGRKLVSLPFSIYGGPLADTEEALSALMIRAVALLHEKGAGYIEIRPSQGMDCAESLEYKPKEWGMGVVMDLTKGKEKLWEDMTERFNVGKAERKGLLFSVVGDERLPDFYRLQLMTRKKQGLPTPSLAYYASFFEKLPGMVKLAIVEKDGEAIAGDIIFLFKRKVLLVLNASDRRFGNYKPNDFMIWNIIQWGCDSGFESLDHGPIPFGDKGLVHFKRKWGGSKTVVYRYYYPDGQEMGVEKGSLVFRIIPIRIAGLVGSRVIKNFA